MKARRNAEREALARAARIRKAEDERIKIFGMNADLDAYEAGTMNGYFHQGWLKDAVSTSLYQSGDAEARALAQRISKLLVEQEEGVR